MLMLSVLLPERVFFQGSRGRLKTTHPMLTTMLQAASFSKMMQSLLRGWTALQMLRLPAHLPEEAFFQDSRAHLKPSLPRTMPNLPAALSKLILLPRRKEVREEYYQQQARP